MTSSITSTMPCTPITQPNHKGRIRFSPLTEKICNLMRECIVIDKEIHGDDAGADKLAIAEDPMQVIWKQEKCEKNITKYIQQLNRTAGEAIDYFSDEEIKTIVDPYFECSRGYNKKELGMEKS